MKPSRGNRKLSAASVRDIVRLYEAGWSLPWIARFFSVCPQTVKNVLDRKTWKRARRG